MAGAALHEGVCAGVLCRRPRCRPTKSRRLRAIGAGVVSRSADRVHRPLSPLSYLPLIIIWIGIDELPKLLLIFLSCFAPPGAGIRSASHEQTNARVRWA